MQELSDQLRNLLLPALVREGRLVPPQRSMHSPEWDRFLVLPRPVRRQNGGKVRPDMPRWYVSHPIVGDRKETGCRKLTLHPVKKSSWAKTEQCNSGKWCCKANDDDDCCNDGSEQFRLDMPDPTEPSATSDSDTGTPSTQATQQQPIVTVTRGPTDDGGLSNGSKGAIGGSIGGVAAIALAVVVWWILRKKRTARGGTVNGDRSPGGGYHGGSTKTEPVLSEAGGSPILESDSRPKPPVYEIGGT